MDPERYDRQIRIPEIGLEGQRKLERSSVLVIGAGGLGSPAILYLAAAGVGRLGIADGDRVALSNLNRQVLHGTADLGELKVRSAERQVRALNPEVVLEPLAERLDATRVATLAHSYDLLVDATDGFASKLAVNDGALAAGKPFVHAGVEGTMGQVALLGLPSGPCLRCLLPEAPADPDEPRPILGAIAGMVGALEASVAVQALCGALDHRSARLLVVDPWRQRFHSVALARAEGCRCGQAGGAP